MLRELKERLRRVRWLEWTGALLWGALGAAGAFYVPRLKPVFDSFGAELPASTSALLRSRPLYLAAFAAAAVRAAFLLCTHREQPASPRRRAFLWASVAAALLAAYGTVAAVFAPMCRCTLAGP